MFEQLETRTLMSLLGINLGNALPQIVSQNPGTIQYTTGTPNGSFTVTTTDITLFQSIAPGGVPTFAVDPITPDTGGSAQSILSILVNSGPLPPSGSGGTATGVSGSDLSVSGMVTVKNPDGTTGATYDGVLLTGEVEQFGFEFDPAQPDGSSAQGVFDFRFQATGGLLSSYFAGQDIGMTLSSVGPDVGPVPPTDFSQSFTYTEPKANIGPIPKLPSIVTNAIETNGTTVGTATISDSATLSGGNNPGGTISFTLTQPDGTTVPEGSVAVSGDGTYNSPVVVTTQVGPYTWHATYSGDGSNPSAVDNGANETVSTTPAHPSIATTASSSSGNVVGSALLADTATLTGGFNETGTISFTLTQPDGSTIPAGSVAVHNDGNYSSPSFLATEVGTYTWHASYSGDTLNTGAIDNGVNESFTTVKDSPAISTMASETSNVAGSALLSDSVTVTGGDHPTGTVTFLLTQPDGTTVPAGSITINGDGTYAGPTGILATEVGTYTFHATYAGDSLNNGAIDNGNNESVSTVNNTGYSVAGIVYCDNNVNATFDTGDELLAGAVVTITDSGGHSVKNTFGATVGPQTTGANGAYSFSNLPAGTYIVTVTTPAPGHLPEQASGGAVTLNTKTVTVGPSNASNQNFPEIQLGAIEGFVWDDTNCDGNIDWNEVGIQGVTITLSGVNYLGKTVTVTTTTADSGEYIFAGLLPGTYSLKETQPAGFNQCSNSCGTFNGNQCGTLSCNDTITGINVAGCDNTGINFNFGDKDCTGEGHGAAATIGFWHNKNGQALLLSLNGGQNATGLGNWLATMFPNMYGANAQYDFAGWTNKQIASFYITNDFNVTGVKLNAQVLSVAFACYVTSSNLAGTGASSYGFTVTATGTGYDLINVGTNGAAFGVANYTSISILQALEATNADASNGVLYASSETVLGTTYSSSTLQSMANNIYSAINQNGDIT